MTPRRLRVAAVLAALVAPLIWSAAAGAHVTPQDPEAPSGAYFTTAFKVGHGCDGSPTTKVELKLADGVTSVKPQPVPGWELSTTTRTLDPPIELHGTEITETVDTVIWEGGPLPDDQLQMFWVSMKLPEDAPGTALEFPVVQTCEVGETAWIQSTVEGEEEPESPAPIVTLTEADGGHGSDDEAAADGEVAAASVEVSDDDGTSGAPTSLVVVALVLGVAGLATGVTAMVRSRSA